jgi:hypothetical protein
MDQLESINKVIFYTYLWLREDGTPYYVGKGKGIRAFYKMQRKFSPPPKERIIIQHFSSEMEALEAEKFLISFYGRKDLGQGCLHNFTDGGEGVSGLHFSIESRLKISECLKGNKHLLGHSHSYVTRQKISAAIKGKRFSEEHRQKIAAALRGKPKSAEHMAKLILSRNTPEYRAHMSSVVSGRIRTPEHSAKIWVSRRKNAELRNN